MQDYENEGMLPPPRRNRGERRVYQYSTGRGGVPIGNESPMGNEDELRDYQYATGRGGMRLSRQEIQQWEKQFKSQPSQYGKGPKGWKISDDRIKDDVCEALFRSYDVDASDIGVEVKDGCVFLRGNVDTRQTKKLAEDVVENIAGVKDVQNLLTFKRDEPRSNRTDSSQDKLSH